MVERIMWTALIFAVLFLLSFAGLAGIYSVVEPDISDKTEEKTKKIIATLMGLDGICWLTFIVTAVVKLLLFIWVGR